MSEHRIAGVEGVVPHGAPLTPLPHVPIAKTGKSDLTVNSVFLDTSHPVCEDNSPSMWPHQGPGMEVGVGETQLP